MKKLILIIIVLSISVNVFGQIVWEIDFENWNYYGKERIFIDTVSNENNIWQIAQPSKVIFNSAYSIPNVIVTDTLNYYPPNDTSSFIVIHLAQEGWEGYPKVDIGGWYNVDTDTLTDFGYIDFSPDKGNTWYLADDYHGYCLWGPGEELPTFTGNSGGWKYFYYCLDLPIQVNLNDTILYRFTFISDENQTNKEGLMFDNLHFEDWSEDIEEYSNSDLINIFPNPSSGELSVVNSIETTNVFQVQIIDIFGKTVLKEEIKSNKLNLNLPNGLYFMKFSDNENIYMKKLIIEN